MIHYQKLKDIQPDVSLEDLWRLTSQAELSLKRGKKDTPLLDKPLAAAQIKTEIRTTAK